MALGYREALRIEGRARDLLITVMNYYGVSTSERLATTWAVEAWREKMKANPDYKPVNTLEHVTAEYVGHIDRFVEAERAYEAGRLKIEAHNAAQGQRV